MDNPTPQFGTAEYLGSPGVDRCHFCQQPVTGSYYRLNGQLACGACAEQVRNSLPRESHAAYTRALLHGIGAAIVGLILFPGSKIEPALFIESLPPPAGWRVGKPMRKAPNGLGGRRY